MLNALLAMKIIIGDVILQSESDQCTILPLGGEVCYLFSNKWVEATREKDKMLKISYPLLIWLFLE